ncbi:MAG TPA: hypothetical protein VK714_20465 [Myxococcota bacterium]|nr:hypothetical protein [Myxococcota bacterium]
MTQVLRDRHPAPHAKVIQQLSVRVYGPLEGKSPMDLDLMGIAVGLAMMALVIALSRAGNL